MTKLGLMSSFRPFSSHLDPEAKPAAWDDEKDDKKDSKSRAEDDEKDEKDKSKSKAEDEKDEKDKAKGKSKAVDEDDDEDSDKKRKENQSSAADNTDDRNEDEDKKRGAVLRERRRILTVLAWACPKPDRRLRLAVNTLALPDMSANDVIGFVEASLDEGGDQQQQPQPQPRGELRERMTTVNTPVVGNDAGGDKIAPNLAQMIVAAHRKANGEKV